MTTTPLSQEHLDLAIIRVRDHGANIGTGGSRCNTTWGYSAQDGWYRDDFDEGWSQRFPATEKEIRRQLNDRPADTLTLLYCAARKPAAAAMLRDDYAAALDALDAALIYGPALDDDVLLRALITEGEADEATRATLYTRLSSSTMWHVLMNATGWDKSPENAKLCLRLLDRALQLIESPPPPEAGDLRATLLDLSGDHAAALPLFEARVARPELYAQEHQYAKNKIIEIKKLLGLK